MAVENLSVAVLNLAAVVEEIEKCMTLPAQNVAVAAKSPSAPVEKNQCTVVIVLRLTLTEIQTNPLNQVLKKNHSTEAQDKLPLDNLKR